MKQWASSKVVSMVDVTGGFLGGVQEVASPDKTRNVAHHISAQILWQINLCLSNVLF